MATLFNTSNVLTFGFAFLLLVGTISSVASLYHPNIQQITGVQSPSNIQSCNPQTESDIQIAGWGKNGSEWPDSLFARSFGSVDIDGVVVQDNDLVLASGRTNGIYDINNVFASGNPYEITSIEYETELFVDNNLTYTLATDQEQRQFEMQAGEHRKEFETPVKVDSSNDLDVGFRVNFSRESTSNQPSELNWTVWNANELEDRQTYRDRLNCIKDLSLNFSSAVFIDTGNDILDVLFNTISFIVILVLAAYLASVAKDFINILTSPIPFIGN